MAKRVNSYYAPQIIELPQSNNQTLFILNVDLQANVEGDEPADSWNTETIEWVWTRKFYNIIVKDSSASVTMSRIYNQIQCNWSGWMVHNPKILFDQNEHHFLFQADVGVRDTDGHIEGVSFTANILIKDTL